VSSVFVDTDVILDLFIRREPHHGVALRLFSRFRRSKIKCMTSPVVVANLYYLLAKLRNKAYALERIRRLRRLVGVAIMDETGVDAALAAPGKDFEDSLQYQCALRNNIPTLITRNTGDFPRDRITVLNPTDYLDMVARDKDG
jgi:predicted nucleic acid-binding protein